mmetsp:Transcript_76781/g.94246  ORF Transcript_76781/g.94246 Transcript_76781/m.94246 type:complete len:97 (+) Transcript_76781:274-564(+)
MARDPSDPSAWGVLVLIFIVILGLLCTFCFLWMFFTKRAAQKKLDELDPNERERKLFKKNKLESHSKYASAVSIDPMTSINSGDPFIDATSPRDKL